jgi:hypothetical protein
MAGLDQLALNIIDRQVLLSQSDGVLADAITSRGVLGTMLGSLEESGALGGLMAELVTEDAESAWGVIEAAGDLGRRQLVQEVGAEGFVLALEWRFGRQKEFGLARMR